MNSIKTFAEKYGFDHGDAKNLAPLSFLAPTIVEDILAGRQPIDLNARNLKYVSNLPFDWNDQRQFLGFNSQFLKNLSGLEIAHRDGRLNPGQFSLIPGLTPSTYRLLSR